MPRTASCLLLIVVIGLALPAAASAQGAAAKKLKSANSNRVAKKSAAPEKSANQRDDDESAITSSSNLALPTGRPGDKKLTGAQTPTLILEKIAPAEVQIGKPARFEVRVRNVGTTSIHGVEIHDEVPAGAELSSTEPKATVEGSRLSWSVGELAPGAEEIVAMVLIPAEEGEIGSLATVRFAAQATARSRVTRPQLKLEVISPREVLIGDDVQITIRLSNIGTGPATGVVLTEVIPANCLHDEGPELEQEVGDLKPGETREFPLTVRAAKAGQAKNLVHVVGEGRLKDERISPLTVLAPALAVNVQGPKRRYLERQAKYTLEISNPGTAPARDVELVAFLPKGLKFEQAEPEGEYDPQTRSVRWSRDELLANDKGTVNIVTRSVEPGEHKLRVEGSGSRGLQAVEEKDVLVEGVAAILSQVVDLADPIEVGEETEYEIRIDNQGSKDASQVVLTVVLPPGLKAISADGPVEHVIQGSEVRFSPLDRLAPKDRDTYRVRVEGTIPGDQRVLVHVRTADQKKPVTKEESTRVYSDEDPADSEEEADESEPAARAATSRNIKSVAKDAFDDDESANDAEEASDEEDELDDEEPTAADEESSTDDEPHLATDEPLEIERNGSRPADE